jgi:hypothetical protein
MRSAYSKVTAQRPRNCLAPARTPADLATVTKLPRTASAVRWSEARSQMRDTRPQLDPITGLSCWENLDVEASVTGYCKARLACIQFFRSTGLF